MGAPRLYRLSLLALAAGLVLLAGVMVLGSGLGAWSQPTAGPLEPTTASLAVPPTGVPPTVTALSPTSTRQPTATATAEATTTVAPPTETPVVELTVSPTVTTASAGPESVVPAPVADPSLPERRVDRDSPFHERLWVGLYGTPAGRGLGILGTTTATETVSLAIAQALAYQEVITTVAVVPFFHMVVTIADPVPGPRGDYVHRVPTMTVQLWIDVAREHGLLSVLDVQPGHSPLATELAFLEPFVRQPGVHVAIDPEFMMLDGAVPGRKLGLMTGDWVNVAQAWLNDIASETGERKVLVIHQFDDRMFSGKEDIGDYPLVELVWDADGFGPPGAKIADYHQYAREPGFEYGGFKLFYGYDTPLMTPAQVLELQPLPAFVVYQ
jgi:hypothetical protein